MRENFIRWARVNLSPADFQRALETDETYRRTEIATGLMKPKEGPSEEDLDKRSAKFPRPYSLIVSLTTRGFLSHEYERSQICRPRVATEDGRQGLAVSLPFWAGLCLGLVAYFILNRKIQSFIL